ncbi:MAG: hypothetical protein AB7O59_03125 [Pirellulales bacterium]
MRFASDSMTDTSNLTSTAGSAGFGQGAADGPAWGAQSVTLALIGIAGAIFLFAAWNTFSRTAMAKVRKR